MPRPNLVGFCLVAKFGDAKFGPFCPFPSNFDPMTFMVNGIGCHMPSLGHLVAFLAMGVATMSKNMTVPKAAPAHLLRKL